MRASPVPVDARELHGLLCRGDDGQPAWHHSLNDLVWRVMAKADIPALKEPSGQFLDVWDVTVSDTLPQSCVCETSQTHGSAAEATAERKASKYASLSQSFLLVPITADTMCHQQGREGIFVRPWKAHHTMHR